MTDIGGNGPRALYPSSQYSRTRRSSNEVEIEARAGCLRTRKGASLRPSSTSYRVQRLVDREQKVSQLKFELP